MAKRGSKVGVSIEGGVARITLVDGESHNTIDLRFAEELTLAAQTVAAEPTVRLIVIAAEGDSFSFGGDIDVFLEQRPSITPFIKATADGFHEAILALRAARAPIMTVVNGMAAGGGFSLALVGDMIVAKRSARFNVAYTRSGLTPDGGSTYFLPRQVGYRRAFDLMATNPTLTADQAHELGIVSRVFDDDGFEEEVDGLIAAMATAHPHALANLKALLRSSVDAELEDQLAAESMSISTIAGSAATLDILDAFVARRKNNTPR